jgi:hypothetical protein
MCPLWSTNCVYISQKTPFFIVTAVNTLHFFHPCSLRCWSILSSGPSHYIFTLLSSAWNTRKQCLPCVAGCREWQCGGLRALVPGGTRASRGAGFQGQGGGSSGGGEEQAEHLTVHRCARRRYDIVQTLGIEQFEIQPTARKSSLEQKADSPFNNNDSKVAILLWQPLRT